MGRKHCGKRRNCSLRAISSFPTVFSKGLFPRGVKRCHCVGRVKVNLPSLSLSQMTNFGFCQTERVCRWQFQMGWKWQKVIQTGRKHCGKKEKLLVMSNFSFSHSVLERLVLQTHIKQGLFGKELNKGHYASDTHWNFIANANVSWPGAYIQVTECLLWNFSKHLKDNEKMINWWKNYLNMHKQIINIQGKACVYSSSEERIQGKESIFYWSSVEEIRLPIG